MQPVQKTFGFGLRAFKKFPELIPLVAIFSTSVTASTIFLGYSTFTKPDVRINKRNELAPWEEVKPTESRKILLLGKDEYKSIPVRENLRAEIGGYRP